MSATVISAEVLARRRAERERLRREREALAGSILSLLDDDVEPDQSQRVCGVASEPKGKTT